MKSEQAHPQEFWFPHKQISDLGFSGILKYSAEILDTGKRDFLDIEPEQIEISSGVFTLPNSNQVFPLVEVAQSKDGLCLNCSCKTLKTKLCVHQAQVLVNVLERKELRIFFDEKLRSGKFKEEAKAYGMENELNLDSFFEIKYFQKEISINPILKGLVKVNAAGKELLKSQLLTSGFEKTPILDAETSVKKRILVLHMHKYYAHLSLDILEGETTKDGKMKNPLASLDSLELALQSDKLEETRFYTAVSKFQKINSNPDPEKDIQTLKWIVKKPQGIDVFYHNKSVSENITASSISPIEMRLQKMEIKLSVFKKEPFHEVSGELIIHDKSYPIKALPLVFSYFIQLGTTFNLVPDAALLRVLEYFKTHHEKVLIHSSQFEDFQKNILAELENRVAIQYAYIAPATKKQQIQFLEEGPPRKLLYLSENQDYIYLTPVVLYGQVEIPVFSRKQIYDKDVNGNVFSVERDNDLEIQFTSILIQQHPDFEDQMGERNYFYLHKSRFLDENWFPDVFETWRGEGIEVLGFKEISKNRINSYKCKVLANVSSGIDWFRTDLTILFGDQQASLKQVKKAIRNRSKYVMLDDGSQGILPEVWIKKLQLWFESGEIDINGLNIPKTRFREIESLFDEEIIATETKREIKMLSQRILQIPDILEVEIPKELKATLRDYQIQGLQWLNFLDEFNFGACLADDMGLGKTVQIIAFILTQRKKQLSNCNLVVVPTSLIFNWQAEVEKFAPSLKIFIHYGPNRIKTNADFDQFEIVLTTYGMLLSDIGFLKLHRFNYIFLDESQAIKNPESQRYKAARLLQARNRVVLTGTPIENNTFDIYGQLSFACPGLLGSKQNFRELYSSPIDKFQDFRKARELQEKIKPFILRRTKKEVAKELPDKTEMVIYCEMGEDQRAVYNFHEQELREYISSKTDEEIKKSSMHVLTGITKLRQICNAPALVKGEENQGEFSSKIEVLMEQIESKSSQHKILVFSQFVRMLDLVKKELEARRIPFEYLTGQTKDRAAKVNSFQENTEVRVFLISLKAGGTGLNLTEADYVYIIDPWWNPAVENQAIDRCYRIGQKKNVIAIRLICPNTIEEKIMKLQASKNKLVSDLIRTEDDIFRSLSREDLVKMLG